MKKVAITMGEPGGIGPEVALRAVLELKGNCQSLLVGDREVFDEIAGLLHIPDVLVTAASPEDALKNNIVVIDVGRFDFSKGRPTAEGGRGAAESIKKAVELATHGLVDAIVTAPISKDAFRMAGLPWPGHTEMLAELTGADEFGMMLTGGSSGGSLRVMLVTIHTALRDVPRLVKRKTVLKAVRLSDKGCRMFDIPEPKIAVAGLNPHAGEGGMFGDEESEVIEPAIEDARAEGFNVSGPYPPDTIYHQAWKGEFDIVVSMYHDQGLIPLKLIAFERGVNVTVGIPIIRTSPDHGTAYNIAWKGKANPSSMIEAVKAAISISLP